MPITGLHHYNLTAHRTLLDTLREFYVSVVGLSLGQRPPFQRFGYWLYVGNRDVLHLTEAQTAEHRPSHTVSTFDHVAFSGTDVASLEARLRKSGVQFTSQRVPQTGELQVFFADPAGNGVEVNFE